MRFIKTENSGVLLIQGTKQNKTRKKQKQEREWGVKSPFHEKMEDVKMVFYESRYKAYKDKCGEHTVRKVDGGWMLMTWAEFEVWKNQK